MVKMARKSDEERLRELEEKIEQTKAKKQQIASRIQQKERKERTRRLIQVGAIFEKYFDVNGEEEAEQVAYGMKDVVSKNKDKLKNIDVEKSKEQGSLVYKVGKEKLIIPDGNPETPYKV